MMMKKVANSVALQTVGYSIPGDQKVKIIAYPTKENCWYRTNQQVLFNDVWSNFSDLDDGNLFVANHTAVSRLEVEVDSYGVTTLVISVVVD